MIKQNHTSDVAQPAPESFNRKQVEAICRAVCKVEGLDPDDDTFGDGCDLAWTRYADAVAGALAAQPPAAPVETERKTFTIPPGYEAVRDSEGRATGEVRPQSSAETARLDWQTASQADCSDALYQIGGALRRIGRFDLAQSADKIAEELYYGEIKPAPIVPRTTT